MSTMTLEQIERAIQGFAGYSATHHGIGGELLTAASEYAALLRERESAKAAVTDEPRNEFPLLYDNLDALDERAAEQPNRIATARILTELRHQIGYVMTKLHSKRAALEAVAPMLASARVPDGWQLVPVEATDEMCEAAWESDASDYVGEHKCIRRADLAYKAMLAAAGEPKHDA